MGESRESRKKRRTRCCCSEIEWVFSLREVKSPAWVKDLGGA